MSGTLKRDWCWQSASAHLQLENTLSRLKTHPLHLVRLRLPLKPVGASARASMTFRKALAHSWCPPGTCNRAVQRQGWVLLHMLSLLEQGA